MDRPSKMNDGLKSAIQLLRFNGMGIKQIAKECGVGIGTVYSVI
jgi:AcrR family transcriptional regulator